MVKSYFKPVYYLGGGSLKQQQVQLAASGLFAMTNLSLVNMNARIAFLEKTCFSYSAPLVKKLAIVSVICGKICLLRE